MVRLAQDRKKKHANTWLLRSPTCTVSFTLAPPYDCRQGDTPQLPTKLAWSAGSLCDFPSMQKDPVDGFVPLTIVAESIAHQPGTFEQGLLQKSCLEPFPCNRRQLISPVQANHACTAAPTLCLHQPHQTACCLHAATASIG